MEPSTPTSGGNVATGGISSLTSAKATTLAQAWISEMNRIPHFSPEPSRDDDLQRVLLSRGGVSLDDVWTGLFAAFHPWVRSYRMNKAARELGITRKHTRALRTRFDDVWPTTRSLSYAEQVTAIADALSTTTS